MSVKIFRSKSISFIFNEGCDLLCALLRGDEPITTDGNNLFHSHCPNFSNNITLITFILFKLFLSIIHLLTDIYRLVNVGPITAFDSS